MEELYDWQADPLQLHNLAGDPNHSGMLEKLRGRLDQWISETGDQGQKPETDSRYDSDMAEYLGKGNPAVEKNIAQMKAWAKAGK